MNSGSLNQFKLILEMEKDLKSLRPNDLARAATVAYHGPGQNSRDLATQLPLAWTGRPQKPLGWRRRSGYPTTTRSSPRSSSRSRTCAEQGLEDQTTMDDDNGIREGISSVLLGVPARATGRKVDNDSGGVLHDEVGLRSVPQHQKAEEKFTAQGVTEEGRSAVVQHGAVTLRCSIGGVVGPTIYCEDGWCSWTCQ
jgi:hypothetical protein